MGERIEGSYAGAVKIALVHELLTKRGGAERVLRVIADMFPDAPIYTFLYDERRLSDWFPKHRVRTSSLQPRFPLSALQFSFNHHLHLRRFPAAAEAWDFSDVDLVLSTSSAFAHGIITNSAPLHLCYVHSPARYLWDRTHDVLERSGRGILGPFTRAYLSRTFHRLRIWDSEAADRPDALLAASAAVQRRIQLYWRRESTVLHPPLDDVWFEQHATSNKPPINYFLIVSQLVPYKRIDLAIHTCNREQKRLLIAGEGPARRSLEAIAGPTVEFLGYRTEEQLKELYAGAQATLLPGEEDFGLVPLESMACGTPVIALRAGGALETVEEGTTGMFFDTPTSDALAEALNAFDPRAYSPDACRARARAFSRERFERALRGAIAAMMESMVSLRS